MVNSIRRRFAVGAALLAGGSGLVDPLRPAGATAADVRDVMAPIAAAGLAAQDAAQAGSIRGVVTDKEFEVPLGQAHVTIVETGQRTGASEDGNFVFSQVAPGSYTLIFAKDGYTRQVRSDVVVTPGQLTDLEVALSGEFSELEEFLVQDVSVAGSESDLLKIRFESPQEMDSVGSELMKRVGASDAAAALKIVAGASVQDGKYAVIRGLPDRYVVSLMNGVRLPTADENKRAVQLDQFPSAVIESIQVSKTFTPDQQGDASGGAVNVVLKGIPDETTFQISGEYGYNSQVGSRRDFLGYKGGGVNFWGNDRGGRDQQLDLLGQSWKGAAGVSREDAPTDYKWSVAGGSKYEFDNGVKIGGFGNFFYERDSSFYDDGVNDSKWVVNPGEAMTPEFNQGTPADGDFKTKLFDVTEATESVQWGGLGTFGLESENNSVSLTYLYTRIAEDTATLAEDTRGKEFFFPGYDPDDPTAVGNLDANIKAAPYIRTETLQYTERTTDTVQLRGKHKIPTGEFGAEGVFMFQAPEIDWSAAFSSASLDQPDKRQFGSLWHAASFNPGFPPFIPAFTTPAVFLPYKPGANFLLGNYQRIWKDIQEDSDQYATNLKLPFKQWSESDGYIKFGYFNDHVKRKFNQDTFSNFNDNTASFQGEFSESWSAHFTPPFEDHPITDGPPFVDVDYKADQKIKAWYSMMDLPLTPYLNLIGGARFEDTNLGIVNIAEDNATWFPEGAQAGVALGPGDADVDFKQRDALPSIGLVLKPVEHVTFRASYTETVARQTFKELTPILQQEFLGGDIFIGNPELQMSALENFDLRLDYTPYEGGLFSVSWFRKDVTDPIEYVQRVAEFVYTTPVNYPKGELSGFEIETRQSLGHFWDKLEGLSLGANATFIDSEVTLTDEEIAGFEQPNIQTPMTKRDMTNAPEFLYNIYGTYDIQATGTQLTLFYNVQGDTLVAGAGQSFGHFVPDVYAKEVGTLNFTASQKLGKHFKLQFQAKNLTNPDVQEVYRSSFIGGDVLKTSYTRGIDFSIALSAEFTF